MPEIRDLAMFRDKPELVGRWLSTLDSVAISGALVEVSKEMNFEQLGMGVMPALMATLLKDGVLFTSLSTLVTEPNLPEVAARVILEHLHSVAMRVTKERREAFWARLRELLKTPNTSTVLKQHAVSMLAGVPSDQMAAILVGLLEDDEPALVDEVARVATVWQVKGVQQAKELLGSLIPRIYRKEAEGQALSSAELACLSVEGSAKSRRLLESSVQRANTPQQRDRTLRAVSACADPDTFLSLMRLTMKAPTRATAGIWRSKLADNGAMIDKLATGNSTGDYLQCLALAPLTAHTKHAARLAELLAAGGETADRARALVRVWNERRQRELLVGAFKKLPVQLPAAHDNPIDPPLGEPYATGFQVGDAIYRAGYTCHGHAGLFLGFDVIRTPQGRRGALQGIHMGHAGDGVFEFSSAPALLDVSPTLDLAHEMGWLRKKFCLGFANGTTTRPFIGARSHPAMTLQDRLNIVETARSFLGRGIRWCYADQIKDYGLHWAGTIGDIRRARCDGLVEFSYEKNGVQVCKGEDGAYWNVAVANDDSLDNHNNYHEEKYGDAEHGEICPKIQAGDLEHAFGYTDTALRPTPERVPTIIEFSLSDVGLVPPCFTIGVSAPDSLYVYARLTVEKKGWGSLFAQTTGLGASHTPEEPVGTWNLLEIRANQFVRSYWEGDTSTLDQSGEVIRGVSLAGQAEMLQFRLQVIDQGGNVSREHIIWKNNPLG